MYRGKTVGIVVPAYNEEAFVGDVLRGVPKYVDRIYAIDDCSTDDTWEEICQAMREQASGTTETPRSKAKTDGGENLHENVDREHETSRIVAFQHDVNLGAGGAIKTGYFAARRDDLDVTATVDGDGQMDLSQLPRLLDPIVDGEADYTKGNRLATAETRADMPMFRLLGNVVLTAMTRAASGYWDMSDSQNGYTAISREALGQIDIASLHNRYEYSNDLLVKLNHASVPLVDVPMPAVYGEECSSIDYSGDVARILRVLLKNVVWRLVRSDGSG